MFLLINPGKPWKIQRKKNVGQIANSYGNIAQWLIFVRTCKFCGWCS